MTEQSEQDQGFHALLVVLRDYVSYGEPGMDDLKEQVGARRRKPVIDAFCEELRQVLAKELPVPTAQINTEFERTAEKLREAGGGDVETMRFDEQEAYEALADLWEFLELRMPEGDRDGAPAGSGIAPPGAADAVKEARPRLLWVDDPVHALKTWMSWRFLALFVVGAVVAIVSWTLHGWIHVGFVQAILQVFTILGFAAAAIGGSLLWLRRARYVNPDAYLPAEYRKQEKRRR